MPTTAEHGPEGPGDAPGALVGHVGEQADRADQNDELEGPPSRQLQIPIRDGLGMAHALIRLLSARGPHQKPASLAGRDA
jgi:hypothetical protein